MANSVTRQSACKGVVYNMIWEAIGFIILLFALIALMPEFDNWNG